MEVSVNLNKVQQKLANAKKECTNAYKKLTEETIKLDEADDEAGKKRDGMDEKIKQLQIDIEKLRGRINSMKNRETRNEYKKDIKKLLTKIGTLYEADGKIQDQMREARKSILNAFSDARSRAKEIGECQTIVAKELGEVRAVLDDL